MSGLTMHVTNNLRGGGAERLLTNVVGQQSLAGEVCVVCLDAEGVFCRTLEDKGVEIIDLQVRRWRDAPGGLLRLAKLVRHRRPALIQGWMYHANVFAFLARCLAGRGDAQLLWGIYNSDIYGNQSTWRNLGGISKVLSPYVDGIVYNAHESREFHRRFGFREPRSIVIPNCIDLGTFKVEPSRRHLVRRELGIGDDTILVVTVARVDPMKDWGGLLEAVCGIPGVVTLGIGKGTDELPPQTGFMGLGWRDDIPRLLSAADVFLLASAFGEGVSLALGEAMACGIPSVVTAVGGNGTFVGDAGIVVPPRQPNAVRAALVRIANDPVLRQRMARRARERISHGHSADEVVGILRKFRECIRSVA